jgi:MoaA/NifB/PqqE/SkfB family radical SAM enzyme
MPEQDLPFDVFREIVELMPAESLVDLNGWGEPLLHTQLADMAALLNERKCIPGFSTNGLLLNEKKAAALMEAGLGYLAFSLDGASPETYRTVRGGNFERVLRNIQTMVRLRAGAVFPQISLTFVMLKTNLDDIPNMVRLAARLGVDFIRLKKVDVFTEADYHQLTYDFNDPYNPAASLTRQQTETLSQVLVLGEELGIGVQVPRSAERQLPFCWMEPEHTVFVNSAGEFAPCCVLGHSSIRFSINESHARFDPFIFASLQPGRSWFSSQLYNQFCRDIYRQQAPQHCEMCPKITPHAEGFIHHEPSPI